MHRYSQEWEKTVKRIGRWIDFQNDYKTLDPTYMESVWWVFKQLWDKGLVYRGFKVRQGFMQIASKPSVQVWSLVGQSHHDYEGMVPPSVCASQLGCPNLINHHALGHAGKEHAAVKRQCCGCRSCRTPLACPRPWQISRPTRITRTRWTRVSW